MRYFVRFGYNGTNYHGSQTQPNGITVQETMEKAFSMILRVPTALTFAGRTDAGVHAEEMWAHFDCETEVNAPRLVLRLNSLLPDSIAVYAVERVTDDAHARFTATARTYQYRVVEHKDPFGVETYTRVAPGLDYEHMNDAAQLLLGRHDFASFCRVHTDVKTTFCTVREAYWEYDEQHGTAVFTITADRFLRNMVRAVVGTLFDIGRKKTTKKDLEKIMAEQDRRAAGQSAPAQGLRLTKIEYPKTIYIQ